MSGDAVTDTGSHSEPDAADSSADAFDELARGALAEVTPLDTIGPELGRAEHDGVVDIEYLSEVPGYIGWHWTVTVAQMDDAEPTVVELAMLPGDGALLAPAWVPWAERLAEYRRTHGGPEAEDDEDLDAGDDDADDDDADDVDVDDEDDEDEIDEDALDEADPLDHDVDENDLVDDFDDDGLDIDEADEDD